MKNVRYKILCVGMLFHALCIINTSAEKAIKTKNEQQYFEEMLQSKKEVDRLGAVVDDISAKMKQVEKLFKQLDSDHEQALKAYEEAAQHHKITQEKQIVRSGEDQKQDHRAYKHR